MSTTMIPTIVFVVLIFVVGSTNAQELHSVRRSCTEGCLEGQACVLETSTSATTFLPNCSIAVCSDCPPGSFSPIPGHPCRPCAEGDYQPKSGASSCVRCPAGTEANVTNATAGGAKSCRLCPNGARRIPGVSTTCEPCSKGFVGNGIGQSECRKCPAGTTSSGLANSTCIPCPEGTFAELPGYAACLPCTIGQYLPNGVGKVGPCIPCPLGTAGMTMPRFGLLEAVCPACPDGHFTPMPGRWLCSKCPAGTYLENGKAAAGRSTCKICPTGSIAPKRGSTSCTPCLPGQWLSGWDATECTNCSVGTYKLDPKIPGYCTTCPPGSNIPTDAVSGASTSLQACGV